MRCSGAFGPLARLVALFGFLLVLPAGTWGQSGGGMGASAANEAVNWYVIAGGGVVGSTDGGNNVLSGTVGQGVVGRVTNSVNVAYQGFWIPLDPNLTNDVPRTPVVAGTRTRLRNYPNPFSATTTISFHLGERSRVQLEVFSRLGETVRMLVDDLRDAGDYSVVWDGFDMTGGVAPSGGYLYRISVQPLGPIGSESFAEQNQMMIVR